VQLVHLGLGTLQVDWALVFFCVSVLSDALSFAVTCVLEEVDHPSSLRSPFYPLLVLVSLHDNWIESRKPWCLLRMS
jgi:hypothetical protein